MKRWSIHVLSGALAWMALSGGEARAALQYRRLEVPAKNQGAGDGMGAALAMDGDTLVAGIPLDDNTQGTDAGAVMVYSRVRQTHQWDQGTKLTDTIQQAGDQCGSSVAVLHDYATTWDYVAVGCPGAGNAVFGEAGAVLLFERTDEAGWQLMQVLTSPGKGNQQFGHQVSLSYKALAVAAPGGSAAYTYRFTSGSNTPWGHVFTIREPGIDGFGKSVAIAMERTQCDAEGVLLIGAPNDSVDGKFSAGAVYSYYKRPNSRPDGTMMGACHPVPFDFYEPDFWSLVDRLLPASSQTNAQFGYSVAANTERAIVGEPYWDADPVEGLGPDCGRATLFEPTTTHGFSADGISETFHPPEMESRAAFGYSVAIDYADVLIGAPMADDRMVNSGAAYHFGTDFYGEVWPLIGTYLQPGQQNNAYYGRSVALHWDDLAFGASRATSDSGVSSGAVYLVYD